MTWSMPRPVLQLVALLIGAASLGSFAVGILTAPPPSRLPGERQAASVGEVIEAVEATPLAQERIEGPPPPPELTPEEKAKLEAERKAKAEAAALAKAEAEAAAQAGAPAGPVLPPPTDRIGEVLEKNRPPPPPPPEEPVF